MTKKEVLDYKVISASKKDKKYFNELLEKGEIILVGDFRNEFGELFVVYENIFVNKILEYTRYFKGKPDKYGITGDEFGWEFGYAWHIDTCCKRFDLSETELKELIKIINLK